MAQQLTHKQNRRAFLTFDSERKPEFCFRRLNSISELPERRIIEYRRSFMLNLISLALKTSSFFAAFAYVYFLRSRGCCTGSHPSTLPKERPLVFNAFTEASWTY
jgi:hypothetical protein